MSEHHGVESQIESIASSELRRVAAGLLDLCGLMIEIDQLKPVGTVEVGEVGNHRSGAVDLLSRLRDLSHRQLASDAERLPEEMLIARLRALGVSWSDIAEATDMNTAGLFKRYRYSSDQPL